jgi:hypothetical protein
MTSWSARGVAGVGGCEFGRKPAEALLLVETFARAIHGCEYILKVLVR